MNTTMQTETSANSCIAAGMQRWDGKVALVTGASTGIGKETVRKLLQHGLKVVGCARRQETLQAMKAELESLGELTTIVCDVSKEEQVNAMFDEIKTKYGGVDVCINNAGLAKPASILSGNSDDWQLMLDVNIMGILRVTRGAVAAMKSKGSQEGHIINISSLSGHRVLNSPGIPVYSATKFAVTAITTGTRHELLAEQPAFNCRVSQISPALVETPFVASYRGENYAQNMFSSFKPLEAVDVAETVIFQLGLPPHVQVQDVLVRGTAQES